MKILAMYLPQFHTFKENDEWWGKGFTEWVNTKKGKPLYKEHYQPKEPLNDNYYNLLDDSVKIWQSNIAKQYGVDGFVFYHYWFNGKKLLEKPVEQMLQNKNIKINYCLSWANEPWTRSWDGKSKQILMPQYYGDKSDWKNHFDYLCNFFKDERYIKIDNKPVLFIYRVNSIDNHEELFEYWINEAKKVGFSGLYLVETLTAFQKEQVSRLSSAVYLFEPMYTTSHEYTKFSRAINCFKKTIPSFTRGTRYIKTNDYDMICKKIINRRYNFNKTVIPGFFPAWDNTARRGNKASIIEGSTPEKFGKYLKVIVRKAEKINSEFVVINAWNEWAEGAYLEPDQKYGYSYLEEIKKIKDDNNE